MGGGKLKAQDWPSTLRRGAGHARWPLGGRMSADEGPNLVEKTPSEAMSTSDEVGPRASGEMRKGEERARMASGRVGR